MATKRTSASSDSGAKGSSPAAGKKSATSSRNAAHPSPTSASKSKSSKTRSKTTTNTPSSNTPSAPRSSKADTSAASASKSNGSAANGGADATDDNGDGVDTTAADSSSPWGIPFGLGGPPPDLTDLGAFIRNQREVAKLSIRRLAELANVSNPYLSQVERGLRNPSPDILQQVANALRISVESLYVKAGILPEQDREVSTVPEAIEHDPRLSAEQKAALRGVYESFLANAT